MKLPTILSLTVLSLVLASCTGGASPTDTVPAGSLDGGAGSSDADVDTLPEPDAGSIIKKDAAASDGSVGPETNPDGVPYPTDKIGITPRKGTTAGNRIANFKFVGYPNGDKSGGLKPISLAQYYDPTHKRQRILHIQASGLWDSPSQAQSQAVAPLKAKLDAREVVWLISIAEGTTPGVPSKQADLDAFIANLKVPCTHVLDPGSANLGALYDAAALPWNADIDTRTMEILISGVGAFTSETAILQDVDDALALAATSTL